MNLEIYYIKRIKGRNLVFLVKKAKDEFIKKIRGNLACSGFIKPYHPSTKHLKTFFKLIKEKDKKCRYNFFFDLDEKQALLNEVPIRWYEEYNKLIEEANLILSNKFELFGSGKVDLGEKIDWSLDFKSKLKWPYKYHSKYSYFEILDLGRPSDIKVPWEMSRLQYLPKLALVYQITKDEDYIKKAFEIYEDWKESNPVGWGIGWASPMDAAIRSVNIIWFIELMRNTPWEKYLFDNKHIILLIEHGEFIFKNLEYSDINGNHFIACILGLIYLGIYLKGYPEAEKWLNYGLRSVHNEIHKIVYPDGVLHEGSIPYHRLVSEMFLHIGILCNRNNIKLGKTYWLILNKMLDFIKAYIKPNGKAPIFGDADDGRLLKIGCQDINDHRYLLAIGASLFNRPDYKRVSSKLWLESAFLIGLDGIKKYDNMPDFKYQPAGRIKAFDKSGYFFLENSRCDYVAVDCADVGLRGRGGHGHNDALNIEINFSGIDIITDSGCFTYSSSRVYRHKTISVESHNVANIDDREPSKTETEAIAHPTYCPTKALCWNICSEYILFEGMHFGYKEKNNDLIYKRHIELDMFFPKVKLIDFFEGSGEHKIKWRFHLSPDWVDPFILPNKKAIIFSFKDENKINLIFEWENFLIVPIITESDYYPSYGVRQKRHCIILEGLFNFPHQEIIFIYLRDNK